MFNFSCVFLYFSNHKDHDGVMLIGIWASSASSICIYVGDLLQPLEMEAEHMIRTVIQIEIDVRLPVLLCELPAQVGKKGEGDQTQPSYVSLFHPRVRGQMRALFCLLTRQQNWCVRKQQILIRSTCGCRCSQGDQGTGSLWLPSPGTAQLPAAFPASHDKVITKS